MANENKEEEEREMEIENFDAMGRKVLEGVVTK
jgi:hypothetical protein